MTCDTARLLSLFNRPGDLAVEDTAALAAHLASCPACQANSTAGVSVDAALASAMKAVTLPTGFKDSLLTSAIRAESLLARRTWLRQGSTVAAVIVTGMLALGGVQRLTKPTVDVESLLHDYEPASRSADYDAWRTAHALPPLPEDFDLNLLSFTGELALEGRSVPAMRLRAGYQQEATVFFVRDSRMKLQNATDAVGSAGTLRVYHQDGWTVIVLHTGTTFAPFLSKLGSN